MKLLNENGVHSVESQPSPQKPSKFVAITEMSQWQLKQQPRRSLIVSDLGKQATDSEFDSHWIPHISGLVLRYHLLS